MTIESCIEYFKKGFLQEALDCYKKIIKKGYNVRALLDAGYICAVTGKLNEAEKYLQEVIKRGVEYYWI